MAGGLGILASTVALGGRDSHPYGPWPRALVCASIRAHGHRWPAGRRPSGAGSGLMLRTSGICCPGSGRRHIRGRRGARRWPVPCRTPGHRARGSTGSMRHPERDRGFGINMQAKSPGSRSTAWGRRVAV